MAHLALESGLPTPPSVLQSTVLLYCSHYSLLETGVISKWERLTAYILRRRTVNSVVTEHFLLLFGKASEVILKETDKSRDVKPKKGKSFSFKRMSRFKSMYVRW